MGRHRKPPNKECCDCGAPFRSYGCIRCPECRTGKCGMRKGGRKGWHICPGCGGRKSYSAKQCKKCHNGGKDEKEG